jgi:hypothetical protein
VVIPRAIAMTRNGNLRFWPVLAQSLERSSAVPCAEQADEEGEGGTTHGCKSDGVDAYQPLPIGHASIVAASRINCPIGNLRGQAFSASLKSSCIKSDFVRVGNVPNVARASPGSW